MRYSELIQAMHKFRSGEITKSEMGCAIHTWQRSNGFDVMPLPDGWCYQRAVACSHA